jgi:hypothetical protein
MLSNQHLPWYECYAVLDSEEGSEIEDIAFGSESEDHWEELSDMDKEEEEDAEVDEVDMLSWDCTSVCGLRWFGEIWWWWWRRSVGNHYCIKEKTR